jgi:hypothetical protein
MNRVENVVDRYVLAEKSFYDVGLNGGDWFDFDQNFGHFRECFGKGNDYPFGFFLFIIFWGSAITDNEIKNGVRIETTIDVKGKRQKSGM